jgi:hypothetical protein
VIDGVLTRRRLVLGLGVGYSLLGAAALRDAASRSNPDVAFDGDVLRRVAEFGVPRTPETSPVPIDADHLSSHRDRAESLLSSAPEAPDIPNEAVAREYADRYETAVEALSEAETAPTPAERLDALRSGLWFAADVSAVDAAFRDGLTREAVLARREPIREELAGLRDGHRYVGDDPAVAVVVHAEVESEMDYAEGMLEQAAERHGDDGNRALRVGSAAGSVELARTAVADAAYLSDRFVDGLDRGRALGGAFERTARTLVSDVAGRCPDPPEASTWDERTHEWESRFGRDLTHTVARPLLDDAFSAARRGCQDRVIESRERRGVASAVLAAAAADRDLRALDRVRTAVDRGDYGVPLSAGTVRTEKLAALEAIERARRGRPATLAAWWTRTATREIRYGDDQLGRRLERAAVDLDEVTRIVASYAWGRSRAEATPGALARLTGALDAAATSRTERS